MIHGKRRLTAGRVPPDDDVEVTLLHENVVHQVQEIRLLTMEKEKTSVKK